MESQNNYSSNNFKKIILILLSLSLITFILIFKNNIFESTLQLKKLGNSSIDPEIAFTNGKPTYLEFYAEWCEICKEMAPEVAELKTDFDDRINFVFLNVDNPKWDKFIKEFKVNGIPQINIIDANANLLATLTGFQEENTIEQSLKYIIERG